MELDFDKIFKIPTKALNISRAHPYIPRDWKWAVQFCIVHGLFTLAFVNIIYNIICHDLKSNNFSQMCKNGVLFVVYIVITFQYCVLIWHQNALVDLIDNMKRDYEQSKDLDSIEKEMFTKYVNLGIWVCKQWLVISIVGTGIFVVKNVVIMLYYYFISEFQLVPLYDLVYPSMIERNKDNIFVFLMTYGLMLLFGSYSALMYIAYVPLGPIFMLHACGQLELVAKRIDDLFVECDNAVISKKLKSIIMQLQYIYSFVDRIKQIFKVAYELTLKGSTIMLPITCYEVLEAFNHGEVSLEFITFIVGGTLISSSPCYYSNLLMEKGENVRLSLYTCGWELHYDRRTRTTLQLMLQNALTPIAINTIFRALCLDALTDLFQQSYAIFNLMNAMWG
uniref:Odorant receptor n=1 Tax=Mythimna separata TaxID=271217 RepID=A0A7H1DHA0_MYTSE|nr:olfactory receptor 33 [Mythimna separata]